MTITYRIHELTDYINWIYFFHAWDFNPALPKLATYMDVMPAAPCG